jgi:hypothetical protein
VMNLHRHHCSQRRKFILGAEAQNDAADAHAVADCDGLVSTMLLLNEVKALASRPVARCRRRQWR